MPAHGIWPWIWFNVFVAVMLTLDLGVFHRKHKAVGVKESLLWTGAWMSLALLFALILWLWGRELGLLAFASARESGEVGGRLGEGQTAIEFLTAYLIEESLSMDNIFVFILIFRYFAIPAEHQHKALFWGIIGAIVLRLSFLIVGASLLHRFHWVTFLFGAVLLYTGIKLWWNAEPQINPEKNWVLRLLRKVMPVHEGHGDGAFVIKRDGKHLATGLLVALIFIDIVDVMFAVDSVPAVLSVTSDLFIAYAATVFAIMGLRALYFALAGIMPLFKDLHYGLSFILVFVGAKMIAGGIIPLPQWMAWVSLVVVIGALAVAMVVSVLRYRAPAASS